MSPQTRTSQRRRRTDGVRGLWRRVCDVVLAVARRQTNFSLASSGLAAVLAVTILVDLVVGHEDLMHAVVISWLLSFVFWALLPLTLGHRYHRWAGFCFIAFLAFWSALSLLNTVHAHALLNALFEAPMIGLYLGWFYRGLISRLTLAAYLVVLSICVLGDASRHDYSFSPLVVLAYTLLISLFCLETGSHLSRSSRRQAMTDPLTGVLNRRGLKSRIEPIFDRAHKNGTTFSFFVIDFDNFKAINDTGGHAAGDEALRICSQSWLSAVSRDDLVARVGGDEFVVLIQDDADAACRYISVLRERSPYGWSWGHIEYRTGDTLDELMSRADQELYRQRRERGEPGGEALRAS